MIGETMLLKRWVTGLAILPFLIFFIYKGGAAFAIFVGVASLLTLGEFYRLVFSDQPQPVFGILPLTGLFSAPVIIWTAHVFTIDLTICVIILNLMICALFSLKLYKSDPAIPYRICKQVMGVLYVPLLLAFAIFIRNGTDGAIWIFFVIAVVFAGDTGAFYAGTYWGKHKLCPGVSPGKTIEGSIGGLGANILMGSIIKMAAFPEMIWGESIFFFLVIGVAGQVGDLFESEFKRSSGIKDSGVIMPGHGGILDRIDALLFALPVAYFFKKYILWV